MVIFNASDDPRTLNLFGSETWTLHPVQAASVDPVVRTAAHDASGFFVPARTTAVFQRTTAVLQAATQRSCAPFPRDVFVRGGFNDWGNPTPTEQYKLQFLGGTSYSVSAPISPAGDYNFKIADAGWTADTNCGSAAGGATVRLGVPITLACKSDSGNLAIAAPSAGDYTFALDASSTTSPVLTVSKTPPAQITLFVRGAFNDWGNGPAPTAPLAWDAVDTYRAEIYSLTAGAYAFKIADNDWGSTTGGATNCGAVTEGTPVTVGQPFTLTCASNSQNMSVALPNDGAYLFAVNWANPAAPQLTIEQSPVNVPIFVRGIGGDWSDGLQNRMNYLGSNIYALNKFMAASATSFKIASSDWSTVDCGASTSGTSMAVGTPTAFACGPGTSDVGITPAVPGTYTFRFNRLDSASGEVTVTGP
jgi:pullulanase